MMKAVFLLVLFAMIAAAFAKPQTNPIENNIGTYAPSENVPIEGEEDADARYRGYGGYGGYRRPYGGYGGSYGGYGGRGYGGYGGYGYRG
ncbi:shematrin-like protein 2 [Artemia franciscana]|uniref:shematrin-like protein 2 n=1 Tax=Artemia franciscana TaxID=6661 RepID=UPI0032DBF048